MNFNCPSSGSDNPWQYFRLNSSTGPIVPLAWYCWWLGCTTHYPSISIQGVFAASVTPTSAYGGLVYATNLSGVALLLTNSPTQLTGSGDTLNTINWGTTTAPATFTAQLIATGQPMQPGIVTSPSQLLTFENYSSGYSNSSSTYASLTLNPVTVIMSACSVNTDSQNLTVTLPTVTTSSLPNSGATSGTTAFKINLTCYAGASVTITMNTTNPYGSSYPGVIAPKGAGYASNVGVRLLLGDGTTAVSFGTAQSIGATPNGLLSIPYYAQYYATGTTGSGSVNATVTFIVSYK
ncbi:fimbrial protein [Rhodanobacter humi]|uniref:Fimbrial protein n=2 Tax=Rhodanobacter TaxID=75309 RepID=A0ABV4ARD2_9GAMM